MKALIIVLILINSVYCSNDNYAYDPNYDEVIQKVCVTKKTPELEEKMKKCDLLDPYNALNAFTSECEKLYAAPGSGLLEREYSECEYEKCYKKLDNNSTYKKVLEKFNAITEEEITTKYKEHYKCIRKALGLNDNIQ